MSKRDLAESFILERIQKEEFDILDRHFVDEFIKAVGCKSQPMAIGADRCRYLSATASRMHRAGLLDRGIIGLENMGMGWPKWVYTYSKPKGTQA
jgi:hypothetical protein